MNVQVMRIATKFKEMFCDEIDMKGCRRYIREV